MAGGPNLIAFGRPVAGGPNSISFGRLVAGGPNLIAFGRPVAGGPNLISLARLLRKYLQEMRISRSNFPNKRVSFITNQISGKNS